MWFDVPRDLTLVELLYYVCTYITSDCNCVCIAFGCSSGHESLLKMNFIPKFAEFNREKDDFKTFGKSFIVLT